MAFEQLMADAAKKKEDKNKKEPKKSEKDKSEASHKHHFPHRERDKREEELDPNNYKFNTRTAEDLDPSK